jgi:hypothetical protein
LELIVFNEEDDYWCWLPEEDGAFSVKSSYLRLLEDLGSVDEIEDGLIDIFEHIWDSPAPSKIIAFSWQLLYERIPTRNEFGGSWSFVGGCSVGVFGMCWEGRIPNTSILALPLCYEGVDGDF